MAIKSIQKYFSLIFLTGILLSLFSAGIMYVNKSINPALLGTLGIGLLCLLISLVSIFVSFGKSLSGLSWKKYGAVLLFILTLIAALVGINYLAFRYNPRFDMTRAKQHTLTPETQKILKNLKQPVKVTVFLVGIPPKYIEDMLGEYERLSGGRILTEIVDPLVQIGYAAQFGNVINADEKRVVVQSKGERKDIAYKEKDPITEQALTNALIRVTREKRKIYFLAGHGEYDIDDKTGGGYGIFKGLLENNNCIVKKIMLGITKEIPSDCDVLVVGGPKDPLTKSEEDIIQAYLNNGGKALFLIGSAPLGTPGQPLSESDRSKNPSLNGILNRWGLVIGDDLVVDLENYVGGDVGCPVTKNYPPHKEIVSHLDYTFYIRPRSISMAPNVPNTVKVAPLVWTTSSKNSWAETSKTLQVNFDKDKDIPGPVAIATVVWEPKNEKKNRDTKIIVFGNADFITDNFVSQYSNAAIVLNSIGWLSELDTIVPIENKTIEVARLNLTSKQIRSIVVILIAMPLFIAALGCLVWWKRNTFS